MSLKSFAHFKRAITENMILRCTHYERPEISGERKITKVQTNGLWYEWIKPDGKPYTGYVSYPKTVSEVIVSETGVTFLDGPNGKPVFTYEVLPFRFAKAEGRVE